MPPTVTNPADGPLATGWSGLTTADKALTGPRQAGISLLRAEMAFATRRYRLKWNVAGGRWLTLAWPQPWNRFSICDAPGVRYF